MTAPRKIFRIEQTAAARLAHSADNAPVRLCHAEIMRELSELRAMLAAALPRQAGASAAPQNGEAARLTSELNLIAGAIGASEDDAASSGPPASTSRMTRLAYELHAVANDTERATQKILAAAEAIDHLARNLSAALGGKIEQGLAQDIRDLVVQIFESCNFQDLIGQRVAKVVATLKFVEDHIARVLDEIKHVSTTARRDGSQSLHGPRLDSDDGHASQDDVDAMFGGGG